jgi:tungstate transport system ATP-binding protein
VANPTRPPILPLTLDGVSWDVGGVRAVDGLGFTLEAGPRSVILGPNGAGKSVTLRLCHGLLRPSEGSIRWRGAGAADAARRQAMVFQTPVMLRRSAAANVAYALALRGIGGSERTAAVERALDRAGLTALAARPARRLSLGEQQRLALARAWATGPEVVFLDEPTASLDPAAARAVEQTIEAMHRAGTKIVMTTHDLGQARRLADEVLFLHRGRLVERAAADAFFAGPQSPEAAAFLKGELLW